MAIVSTIIIEKIHFGSKLAYFLHIKTQNEDSISFPVLVQTTLGTLKTFFNQQSGYETSC